MDSEEQAEAYAETDFSEPHDAFVSYFKSRFPGFSEGSVLDLGCGTADVIIRFAKALPGTHITGIDGAEAMLDIGLRDVRQNGLSHQINLRNCFLPDKDLFLRKFDAIISNSLLHHLGNVSILWDAMQKCSGPGSALFVMDLMRPDNPDRAGELVELHAADAPDILKKDFYNSLLAAYTVEEINEQLVSHSLDYLTVEAVSDRHFLIWGTKH